MTRYICPICGYPDLYKPAYMEGEASYEICRSCGFQYGKTDDDEGYTIEQWREKWILRGMPWWSSSGPPPKDWDPRKQLLNLKK